jgi:hypothetical protein
MKKIVFKKQNRNTLTPNGGMPLSLVILLSVVAAFMAANISVSCEQ